MCGVGVVTRETFFGVAEMFSRGPMGHQGTHPMNYRHFVHSDALADGFDIGLLLDPKWGEGSFGRLRSFANQGSLVGGCQKGMQEKGVGNKKSSLFFDRAS